MKHWIYCIDHVQNLNATRSHLTSFFSFLNSSGRAIARHCIYIYLNLIFYIENELMPWVYLCTFNLIRKYMEIHVGLELTFKQEDWNYIIVLILFMHVQTIKITI